MPIAEVSVNVACYIAEMRKALDVDVVEAKSMEQLVSDSQLVVTTTQSREPLIRAKWLHPGFHITAMGSDLGGKQELDAAVLGKADRIVCDRKSQCFSMGELQHGLAAGVLSLESDIDELGLLASGQTRGRTSESEIAVCDLTRTGVQDTAIAALALEKARESALGYVVEA